MLPWFGAPDCPVCHRTVSGAPPDSVRCTRVDQLELATFGFLEKPLRYNSPDCPVCQAEQRLLRQRSSAKVNSECYSAQTVDAEVRATPEGAPDSEQYLSGGPICQNSNGRTLTVE
jgi:glutaredoxin